MPLLGGVGMIENRAEGTVVNCFNGKEY